MKKLIVLLMTAFFLLTACSSDAKKKSDGSNTENNSNESAGGGGEEAGADCPEKPRILENVVATDSVVATGPAGQDRGGDYKTHAVIRTNSRNIGITAPFAGEIFSGAKYTEQGEVQYLIYVKTSCNLWYLFDHLATVSDEIDALFPAEPQQDTRTDGFSGSLEIEAGEVVATVIGFATNDNSAFDFGVFDLDEENPVADDESKQPSWFAPGQEAYQDRWTNAVCPFDYFDEPTDTALTGLMGADGTSTESDICI